MYLSLNLYTCTVKAEYPELQTPEVSGLLDTQISSKLQLDGEASSGSAGLAAVERNQVACYSDFSDPRDGKYFQSMHECVF